MTLDLVSTVGPDIGEAGASESAESSIDMPAENAVVGTVEDDDGDDSFDDLFEDLMISEDQ
jgi:hypothetical protein